MEHHIARLRRLHADLAQVLVRALARLVAPHARCERGDVPGWVLVTVMTAGLVMVVWGVAEGELRQMLTSALNQVR